MALDGLRSVLLVFFAAACGAGGAGQEGSTTGDNEGRESGAASAADCRHGTLCEAVAAACERECGQDCSYCGADLACIENCVALEHSCEDICGLNEESCERDPARNVCVECVDDFDCAAGDFCLEGTCSGPLTGYVGTETVGYTTSTGGEESGSSVTSDGTTGSTGGEGSGSSVTSDTATSTTGGEEGEASGSSVTGDWTTSTSGAEEGVGSGVTSSP